MWKWKTKRKHVYEGGLKKSTVKKKLSIKEKLIRCACALVPLGFGAGEVATTIDRMLLGLGPWAGPTKSNCRYSTCMMKSRLIEDFETFQNATTAHCALCERCRTRTVPPSYIKHIEITS